MTDQVPAPTVKPKRRAIMVRLSSEERSQFAAACDLCAISQQRALAGLVRMFIDQAATREQQRAAAPTASVE